MSAAYQKHQIERALADTIRYIERESARADDLRPVETQELLEKYIAHKAKLEAMLTQFEPAALYSDCLPEKIKLFLDNAPYWIQEGTVKEMAEHLLLQYPIQNRIQPVAVETLIPLVEQYIAEKQ